MRILKKFFTISLALLALGLGTYLSYTGGFTAYSLFFVIFLLALVAAFCLERFEVFKISPDGIIFRDEN